MMKKAKIRLLVTIIGMFIMCFSLLIGCSGQKLSSNFNEDEVREATEDIIMLINEQDSEGLRELCTVQMKEGLTDDTLKQVYEIIGESGTFEKIQEVSMASKTNKDNDEELAVVVAKTKYENKSFTFTISFTKQMKLAGLYIK